MKKTTLLICLALTSTFGFSQELIDVMRYSYQVDFLTQPRMATEPVSNQEIMFLDIKDGTSRFASQNSIARDEGLIDFAKPENAHIGIQEQINALQKYMTKFQPVVYNDGAQLKTSLRSGLESYTLIEPLDIIKWEILPEVIEFNGMQAQVAKGELNGREWTVYFTQEIALNEGPYKFKNLPGFVIRAFDDQGVFNFELINASKATTTFWITEKQDAAMVVNTKQYAKIDNQNRNKSLSQMFNERGGATIKNAVDKDGNDITKTILEKKQGKNNFAIELY